MKFKKYGDVIFGGIVLAIGLFYFIMTLQIPRQGELIDATFLPYILCGFMVVLGILQVLSGLQKAKQFKEESTPESSQVAVDYPTVLKTAALIVVYIVLLQPLGFIISTSLYLFVQFLVLSPVGQKKNYVAYILTAVITAVLVYLAFRYGLKVILPQGIIKGV